MSLVSIPGESWERIFGNGSTATATKPKPKRSAKPKPRPRRQSKPSVALPTSGKPQSSSPQPGIYTGVSFNEYLLWPYVNNTLLHHAAKSMKHFRAAELNPTESDTDALNLGRLLHTGKLEPSELASTHVVMPRFEEQVFKPDGSRYSNPKNSKQYRKLVAAFEQANSDKVIVTQDYYDRLSGMLESLSQSERAVEYLHHVGPAEISIVWDDPDTGERCKARFDKLDLPRQRIVDLKSTCDAGDFSRSLFNYSYDRQLAFYGDGIATLTGQQYERCIVAVESSEPFCVRAAPLSSEAIESGRQEYKWLLRQISLSRQSGDYPGYDDPDCWELPDWSKKQSQPVSLNVGDQTVTI